MQYVEYIQTDGYCWFDTTIVPTINTEVVCDFAPLSQTGQWNVYYGSQSSDDGPDSFQVRRADKYFMFSVFVGRTQQMTTNPSFAYGDWLHTILNKTDFRYSVNSGATQTRTVNSSSFATSTLSMYIGAVNNPNWFPTGDDIDDYRPGRGSIAKYGEMKIYESGVLVADLLPAKSGSSIGFYDEVSQVFRPNLGTGTPVAGPAYSSISIRPDSKTIKSTGETITVNITTENSWVANPADGSWYTLSETGGTGDTAITITVPSYTGATARQDTITFIDTNTTDEAVFTLKQKKYQSGQPFYLGADEIAEIYLGVDSIAEAYLGEDLVYSSGPFQGVKINPNNISFNSESLTASITIKSSESWTMTTPAWISASSSTGDTGITIITISVTTQTATTTGRIEVSSTNYSASASVNYYNVEFLDYVYTQTLTSESNKYLATNLYPTQSTNGEIIGKLEGYTTGLVLVGQPNQSDSKDWRFFFPNYANWYMDTSNGTSQARLNGPLNVTDAYSEIDIKFGNHYMHNVLNGAFLTASTVSGPLLQVPINICMGVIKIKELKLWEGEELIFDGKAATYNNSYGLFDTVGGNFLTSNDFVITGETSNKTLTISNMGTINGDVETKQITIDGNMSVSVENDGVQETFSPVSTAGYTSSYSNGTITISGPFGNTASLTFYYSTNTAPCLQTNQAETVTFVNNAASTAFDDSVLYTDQECECYQQGGTWEDGGCTYPEPEDPCIADPCMCDPNPDECYCIQQGGTWDGSQCIMPE